MRVIITDEMGKSDEQQIIIDQIKVIDLLNQLKIDPFEAIIMRKGEIITENDTLTNQDEVKVINVIHGG